MYPMKGDRQSQGRNRENNLGPAPSIGETSVLLISQELRATLISGVPQSRSFPWHRPAAGGGGRGMGRTRCG